MSELSVFYIVRNEEALIGQSIESVLPIASEIIVVDTGSVDKTIQICSKFPKTTVYSYSWSDDYAQARNYAMRLCRGPWIMYLDADERLDEKSRTAIRSSLTSNAGAIALRVVDHIGKWDAPQERMSFFDSPQIRVFRKDNRVSFSGRVLESVAQSINRSNLTVNLLDAEIHHFLWKGKNSEYTSGKLRYYNKLGANFSLIDVLPRKDRKMGQETPPQPSSDIAVIMAAYGAIEYTRQAISSATLNAHAPFHYYLVDNGSNDSTIDYFRQVKDATVIRFDENQGVARGKNAGLQEALKNESLQYIVFLDNDVIMPERWLARLREIMDAKPEVGIISPISRLSLIQTSHADSVSKYLLRVSLAELNNTGFGRDSVYEAAESVDGTCMMVRASLARKMGLLDESFGMYGSEDVDYCIRARREGYQVGKANKVFFEHFGGASKKLVSIDWYGISTTSRARFQEKWKQRKVGASPVVPVGSRLGEPLPSLDSGGKKVSIVVIAHNRLDMTRDCLSSIVSSTQNFELVFIDNGSTDGTPDWVEKNIPQAKLIRNEKNQGIPKARNQGIKETTGDIIVLIDNDCVVSPGWIQDLYAPIANGASVSGIEAWFLGSNMMPSGKATSQSSNFGYLGGACCMFRRDVFEEVGLLDEGFSPAYYEDVDWCVRAKKTGHVLVHVPTPKVKHREHATLIGTTKDFHYQQALNDSGERYAGIINGSIKQTFEFLTKRHKKLKILYLGMQWDYADRSRGTSFEHDNFYPALLSWNKAEEIRHFDFADLANQHGVAKMSDALRKTVDEFQPAAIFSVFFEPNHDPTRSVMKNIIDTTPCETINWFCDSHFRYDNFDSQWAPYLSFCVTTSESAYQRYKSDGFGNKVIKSQWFASPTYRKINGAVRDVPVSFVGQPHGDRRQVIAFLNTQSISCQCYGHGWEKRLSFTEMVEMFNRSKVNLNLNNAADARYKQIKGRNFEVPACGGFLLTGTSENLSEYYEFGIEIVTYDGVNDMAEKIKYYLQHDDEREAIALAGYNRTMREHTSAHRLDAIFTKAGLL
jgi:GT2 family glycosyltransferase/spore maturation protein CgeB